MNKKIIAVSIVFLVGLGIVYAYTNPEPINDVYDTIDCFALEPLAYIDDFTGLQVFGFPDLNAVEQVTPELLTTADPFSPYDPITNPYIGFNTHQLFEYCLEPVKEMYQDLTQSKADIVALQADVSELVSDVNNLNTQKELISTSVSIGTSCNTACNAMDNHPTGANYACIHATTLLGGSSTCSSVLLALNCLCEDVSR